MKKTILFDRNIVARADVEEKTSIKSEDATAGKNIYDDYYSRFIKLIPIEVVTFYMTLDGIVSGLEKNELIFNWAIFIVAAIGTWFYVQRMTNVKKVFQRIIIMTSFCLWVYVLGGPFVNFPWYDSNYGKLVLTIFSFFAPMFYKPAE